MAENGRKGPSRGALSIKSKQLALEETVLNHIKWLHAKKKRKRKKKKNAVHV